jgi:hypothetical protein
VIAVYVWVLVSCVYLCVARGCRVCTCVAEDVACVQACMFMACTKRARVLPPACARASLLHVWMGCACRCLFRRLQPQDCELQLTSTAVYHHRVRAWTLRCNQLVVA